MDNTKEYVDSLFAGYGETEALADFKEELLSNLNAKLDSLVKKGMSGKEAFIRATGELGDVSALADEISLKKRQDVFEERYLDLRRYMKPRRVAAYTFFGMLFLFGIISALLAFFAAGGAGEAFPAAGPSVPLSALLGILLAFMPLAAGGFTFLGLTQETSASYPMGKKRAACYTLAVSLLVFGVVLAPLTYFAAGGRERLIGATGTLLPFALPALGILVFLLLSEKSRLKPWARERYAAEIRRGQEIFSGPAAETRFGLISGAIWIFSLALFFIIGFTLGFRFSWIVFILATGMECLTLALMGLKKDS
ncbi:MAG: permease prefix domain 1-containing protein [Treponema sp.]|jgi:hypothetical protein|nr:permease prefix domain 1-containing protein [Treponema sp.]